MRIGLMVSRQGPSGLWAVTCDACTMLAVAELNARGGVSGREIELVLGDAGTAAAEATFNARRLVEIEAVDAVVGMHASDLRAPITLGLAGRVPYVYSPMYEGGEQNRNVLPIGGTDEELLGLAIPTLIERRHARKYFLFGNDYVWPRRAAISAGRIVAAHGGRVVGAGLVPFGTTDYSEMFARIRKTGADVVVTLLLGEETVRFNRAFAAAGLSARVLRLGLAVDETVLYAAGAHAHDNLYVATTFLAADRAPRGDNFVELYRDSFGALAPPATVFGQSCYDAVHLLAGLAQAGRRADVGGLRHRFSRLAGRHPGRRGLPPTLMAASAGVYLAEAQGLELKPFATG